MSNPTSQVSQEAIVGRSESKKRDRNLIIRRVILAEAFNENLAKSACQDMIVPPIGSNQIKEENMMVEKQSSRRPSRSSILSKVCVVFVGFLFVS